MTDEHLRVARVPDFTAYTTATKKKRGVAVVDYTTEAGARRLAERIEHLWHQLGYDDVRADVVRSVYRRDATTDVRFDVRTNLVGGLPPSLATR